MYSSLYSEFLLEMQVNTKCRVKLNFKIFIINLSVVDIRLNLDFKAERDINVLGVSCELSKWLTLERPAGNYTFSKDSNFAVSIFWGVFYKRLTT